MGVPSFSARQLSQLAQTAHGPLDAPLEHVDAIVLVLLMSPALDEEGYHDW